MVDFERDRRPLDIFGVTRSEASEELKSLFLFVCLVLFLTEQSFMITDTEFSAKEQKVEFCN